VSKNFSSSQFLKSKRAEAEFILNRKNANRRQAIKVWEELDREKIILLDLDEFIDSFSQIRQANGRIVLDSNGNSTKASLSIKSEIKISSKLSNRKKKRRKNRKDDLLDDPPPVQEAMKHYQAYQVEKRIQQRTSE